ncbi:hypothetical protein diail_7389 [Diaporthe ilicicola]|nr:hypothetical protein diail_7389 [Diaporthe ilicicola]
MDETIAQEAQRVENWWRQYNGFWYGDDARSPPIEQKESAWSQVLGLWERAPNWHTISELNRRYLQRRLPVCASYGQPPDMETNSFRNLDRLHDYGIISTNSCPGWEYPLERQRAYLFFSIPTRNLQTTSPNALINFVRFLMSSREVYAHIRFQYENPPGGIQRDQQLMNLMQPQSCSNLPEYDDVNENSVWMREGWDIDPERALLWFVQHQTRQNPNGIWATHGHYGISMNGSSLQDQDDPYAASHAADPLQIAVVARDWRFRGIGQLIENLLIRSGIARGFRAAGR